mmetsp:Transcript_13019/g.37478  ORF Transcript_13019/g.37478 Transcript_13019/m.37478 type:complete len:218 (+) Transcript_13019:184-837(+)
MLPHVAPAPAPTESSAAADSATSTEARPPKMPRAGNSQRPYCPSLFCQAPPLKCKSPTAAATAPVAQTAVSVESAKYGPRADPAQQPTATCCSCPGKLVTAPERPPALAAKSSTCCFISAKEPPITVSTCWGQAAPNLSISLRRTAPEALSATARSPSLVALASASDKPPAMATPRPPSPPTPKPSNTTMSTNTSVTAPTATNWPKGPTPRKVRPSM